MRLPRDITGEVLASALKQLGYETVRQTGSHIRLTTQNEGEHHVTIPNHSPTYRSRYAEFLKIDFPRVPLTSNNSLFQQLANYGEELVALHLMKSPKLDIPITQFEESGGNHIVDIGHPKYSNNKITINKQGDGFIGVSEEVWNFYVGGYQVCQKWLKDRKKRALSDEDITHYQCIIVALQETMHLMQQIDEEIPSWPIE